MDFLIKWMLNVFLLVILAIVLYSFFPSVWNLILGLTPGIYRPLLIAGLLIVAGLPALRSSGP